MGAVFSKKKTSKNTETSDQNGTDQVEYVRYIVQQPFIANRNSPDELSVEVDEIVYVEKSSMNQPWWRALRLKTNKTGIIPSNFVAKDDGSIESHKAWFLVGKVEASRKLLAAGLKSGTFILRPSSEAGKFALSVRDHSQTTNKTRIKHFKININDANRSFMIGSEREFPSIYQLVDYYSQNKGGLYCKLITPCPRKYMPPADFSEFEVSRDNIELKEKIGKGNFGIVHRALWNRYVEVAVKTRHPSAKETVEKFIEEAKIMHQLNHPNVVRLMGICTVPDTEPVYIITELMKKGTLKEFLQSKDVDELNLCHLIDIMIQISEGMIYISGRDLVHGDLRAVNVLVDEESSVKLADFGLCRQQISKDDYETQLGQEEEGTDKDEKKHFPFPTKWTAPEIKYEAKYSEKSDIWSFGVLIYEVLTRGKVPYPDYGPHNIRELIPKIKDGYRMPHPSLPPINAECPDELYDFMLCTWDIDVAKRPTFCEAKTKLKALSDTVENEYF